jgi:hypothetical protein
MSSRVHVELIDDLDDNSPAAETVKFSLDSVTYEIDLTEKNAQRLRKYMTEFVSAARRTGGKQRTKGKGPTLSESAQQRVWAAQNGMVVPSHGRVPASVVEAYQKAQG